MDAVRIKDNEMVMIKHLKKSLHTTESDIGAYFSSPPRSSDPRNHCCPVFEVLNDPNDPDIQFIVMPQLRNYRDPPFATVGEAVEFFRQAFEVCPATAISALLPNRIHAWTGIAVHA